MNATMDPIPAPRELKPTDPSDPSGSAGSDGSVGPSGCARYLDDVYRYIRALVASPHDAEDLTQETFRKATLHWPQIRSGDVRAWLFTTARNEVLQHYRHRGTEKRRMSEFQSLLEQRTSAALPATPAESDVRQMHTAAQSAIDALEPLEREAMRLKFVTARSNVEIATALKITPNHLGVVLFRALKKVRQKLEEQGHDHA